MKNDTPMRHDCRLCGQEKLELAVPIRPSPVGDAYVSKDQLDSVQELYPMDLYLCMACSHLQLPYIVDPKVLFANYTYTTSSSPGLINHFESYCEDVFKKLNLSGNGFAVEIGSNDG